jgi:hypothetical protein
LHSNALAPIDAQVVTWVNFRTTVTISSAALETFHALSDDPDHTETTCNKISDYGNFRPLQPLHGRVVYTDGDVADACAQTIPADPAACHASDDDHGDDDGHRRHHNDNNDDRWRTKDVIFAFLLVLIVLLLYQNNELINDKRNRVEAAPAHRANALV